MSSKQITGCVISAIVIILSIVLYSKMFYTVKSTEYVVKQAAVSGTLTVHSEPGMIFRFFGDIHAYPRTMQLYLSNDKEDTDDLKENEFASAVNGTFTGNSTAEIAAFIKIQLPSDPSLLIELHRDWKTPYNVVMDMIRNQVEVGIKSVSPAFTPEEAFVDKRPQFQQYSREVMEQGEFQTFTKEILLPSDTTQKQKVVAFVEREDSLGNKTKVVVKPSVFTKYRISVLQFDIKNFKFDEKTAGLIAAKKEYEQQRVAARSEAETAEQRQKTIIAQAAAEVAKREGEAKVQLIQEVTEARKRFEVAEFAAKEANETAKKIRIEGEAEAFAARQKVAAGLTPLERATIDKETRIAVAQALAQVKFPATMIISGGDSKGGGTNPFDAVGLQALHKLSESVSSGK